MSKQDPTQEIDEIKSKVESIVAQLLDGMDISKIPDSDRLDAVIRLLGLQQRGVEIKTTYHRIGDTDKRDVTVITSILEYMRGDAVEALPAKTEGSAALTYEEENRRDIS